MHTSKHETVNISSSFNRYIHIFCSRKRGIEKYETSLKRQISNIIFIIFFLHRGKVAAASCVQPCGTHYMLISGWLMALCFLLFSFRTASRMCFGVTGGFSPKRSRTSKASSMISPRYIFAMPDMAMTTF